MNVPGGIPVGKIVVELIGHSLQKNARARRAKVVPSKGRAARTMLVWCGGYSVKLFAICCTGVSGGRLPKVVQYVSQSACPCRCDGTFPSRTAVMDPTLL